MPPNTTNKKETAGKAKKKVEAPGKAQKKVGAPGKAQKKVEAPGKAQKKVGAPGKAQKKVGAPGKGPTGKLSALMVKGDSTAFQLGQLNEQHCQLQEELDKVSKQRNYIQLERSKIRDFWDITKRNLEECNAKLRNKNMEMEEAEERHQAEITLHKQKVKYMELEKQNGISRLKADNVAETSVIENQHVELELQHRRKNQDLKANLAEQQDLNQNYINELELKHQVELMDLTKENERKIREIEANYHKKMVAMVETLKKKWQTKVYEVEGRMNLKVSTLMDNNDVAMMEAEEYYTNTVNKQKADQKTLKEEIAEVRQQQKAEKSKALAAENEEKCVKESMQATQQKLLNLQKKEDKFRLTNANRKVVKAQVMAIEKQLRKLRMEHEPLQLAFSKVQQERDALLKLERKAILDEQQKCAMKERNVAQQTLRRTRRLTSAPLSVSPSTKLQQRRKQTEAILKQQH